MHTLSRCQTSMVEGFITCRDRRNGFAINNNKVSWQISDELNVECIDVVQA